MNLSTKQLSIQEILKPIEEPLNLVEQLVMENLETDIPLLTEVGQYILKSGGKRFRPALLLFSAGVFGENNKNICQAANIIEYIHTATLLHDDVVDNADLRRSKKSARSIWGNEASVLVGDYLYAVSFKYLTEFNDLEIIHTLSQATTLMAKGEILQLIRSYETATEKDYLDIIIHKTASLIGAAMKVGSIMGGADVSHQKAFYECGEKIGIAFQFIDDALDYDIENKDLGKERGTDLKERKVTLPLSHLIHSSSKSDQDHILDILDEEIITDEHVKTVTDLIKKYKSVEYTRDKASEYSKSAIDLLKNAPSNEFTQGIINLANFIIYRNK